MELSTHTAPIRGRLHVDDAGQRVGRGQHVDVDRRQNDGLTGVSRARVTLAGREQERGDQAPPGPTHRSDPPESPDLPHPLHRRPAVLTALHRSPLPYECRYIVTFYIDTKGRSGKKARRCTHRVNLRSSPYRKAWHATKAGSAAMDLRMLVPIFGILLVMIPVAGLTFGLTLRLAVKPFVETLAKALRESGHALDGPQASEQVLMLREELEALTQEVRDLRSAQEFDRKLLSERVDPSGIGG